MIKLQQCLPLAVLKLFTTKTLIIVVLQIVATVPTACGIETTYEIHKCGKILELQQYLPLAVCDEGCEAAEEQSDDEVCTSLVPDQREGKTKVMK